MSENKEKSINKQEAPGVCLLNDSFPPLIDGVANAVVNYAAHLPEKGYRVSVVTPEHPDADDGRFPYPVFRYPGIDMRKWVGYVAGIPFSPTLMKNISEEKPALIHSHCPIVSTVVARSIADKLNAPVVMTYHSKFEVEIEKLIKLKSSRDLAAKVLVDNISSCDEIWTVSRGAGESLRYLGYTGEYTVMHNGVDIPRGRLPDEKTAKLTAGYGIPSGVPVFLFVGRLMWYKGIGIILDALAGLKSRGLDFRAVFVGGGGDEDEIRKRAEELKLGDRVIFTGRIYEREKLSALYCRSDLFLFPSTYDTNGLVVREAAACSLPSVLVRGSCAAEDTIDGRNCFHIDENAASLAVCLTELILHPEALARARDHVADDLYISWKDAVAAAADRYGAVIERFRSGGYPKHRRPTDEFFRMSGELMDIISKQGTSAEDYVNLLL